VQILNRKRRVIFFFYIIRTTRATKTETTDFVIVKENGTWKVSKFTYQPTTLK